MTVWLVDWVLVIARSLFSNLVPRVFSAFNMAAGLEKTLAHSELKRSLIGAFLT